MTVLDLRGPEFLQLYLVLMVCSVLLSIALRSWMRMPAGKPPMGWETLDPMEVAFLAGGPKGTTDAAVARMVQAGSLATDAGTGRLTVAGPLPAGAPHFDRVIHSGVSSAGQKLSYLRSIAKPIAPVLARRLGELQLVIDSSHSMRVRVLPAMVPALVLLLGIAKILVGISRNRPVAILVLLCIVTWGVLILFLVLPVFRTLRGDATLAALRRRNAALRSSAKTAATNLDPNDLCLALALFGPAILVGGPLADLRVMIQPPSSGGGSDGGGSSCSGGSSCGGGGGCGGCGS